MMRLLFLCATFLVAVVLPFRPAPLRPRTTFLKDGTGVANTYQWTEDAVELEIRVKVPRTTRAKDIRFKAKPLSVDLKVVLAGEEEEATVLLNGTREMRGRVAMDGTFWNLEDDEEDPDAHRIVVVTIEKNIRASSDDFEVVDYDWGGVYPNDDEEVVSRSYVEAEQLDIRDYAAKMGVDIDNINMSLVDKTMFNSGLNMTKNTMDELSKAGYVEEVNQQADGSEFTIDEESGESVPFSPYGKDVSQEEVAAAAERPKIPFLDTDSPWKKEVPAYNMDALTDDLNAAAAAMEQSRQGGGATSESPPEKVRPPPVGATSSTSTTTAAEPPPQEDIWHPPLKKKKVLADETKAFLSDPIDRLTVKRLKEILREQGLKVSGNKAELQDRLKHHVESQLTSE